jgi:ABC-2 type transport system ATP-binding protein
MIATHGLTKRYGKTVALRDLTLDVKPGEVFGLLGPNGSGKTTMIRLLLGMMRPTRGHAAVGGFDCWRQSLDVRRMVSFLPGELRMYGSMRGIDLLEFLCGLRGAGLDRAVAIAERIMKLDLRRRVRAYSTGMKQKLALSQAFADPVEILILDEPTSALDPSARNEVLELVRLARSEGQTVIFSGHVLPEVEKISDRVAIMRKGRLLHIEDMHARRAIRMILIRSNAGSEFQIPDHLQLSLKERNGDTFLFEHLGELPDLLGWLPSAPIADIAIGTEDLHSLYEKFHGPDVIDDEAEGEGA